jgi:Regulator of G protein signaling domain
MFSTLPSEELRKPLAGQDVKVDRSINSMNEELASTLSSGHRRSFFWRYLRRCHADENIALWESVQCYKRLASHRDRVEESSMLINRFINEGAPHQVNIDAVDRRAVEQSAESGPATLFDAVEASLLRLMLDDCWRSFMQSIEYAEMCQAVVKQRRRDEALRRALPTVEREQWALATFQSRLNRLIHCVFIYPMLWASLVGSVDALFGGAIGAVRVAAIVGALCLLAGIALRARIVAAIAHAALVTLVGIASLPLVRELADSVHWALPLAAFTLFSVNDFLADLSLEKPYRVPEPPIYVRVFKPLWLMSAVLSSSTASVAR